MSQYSSKILSVANITDEPIIATPFVIGKEPQIGLKSARRETKRGYTKGSIIFKSNLWDAPGITYAAGLPGISSAYTRYITSSVYMGAIDVETNGSVSSHLCILAVPQVGWNTDGGFTNNDYGLDVFKTQYEMIKLANDKIAQYKNFTYYICAKQERNSSSGIRVSGQVTRNNSLNINTLLNQIVNYYDLSEAYTRTQKADYYNSFNNTRSLTNFSRKLVGNTSDLKNWNYSWGVKIDTIRTDGDTLGRHLRDSDYYIFSNDTIDLLQDAYDKNDILENVYVDIPFNLIFGSPYFNSCRSPYNNVAVQIESSLPIFVANKKGMEEMIKYFSDENYESDNADELLQSELDLATDWTIYVNGKQRPTIDLTEVSKKVEEYISSDKNTMGLTASDFMIQYRYPIYYNNETDLPEIGILNGYKPLKARKYDAVYQTSYMTLCNYNYGTLFEFGVQDDFSATDLSSFYAQLQFRLYYNKDIFSSWCEFGIGYIGSPSVADFDKMENWGIVTGIQDGSTVTIIYDDYPDGYKPDDYNDIPDDSDDGIKGGNTLPNDSTNMGLNVLTTSYRVTSANLDRLGEFIWNNSIFDSLKNLNNSPVENIVSLKIMPCSVDASSSSIVLGNVETNINADKVTNVPVVDIGSLKFQGYNKSFLDYPPYTQAYIFLPFLGFYELDPVQCTAHTLSVKYSFDIVTGQCKAMLFVDNIYYCSYEGACGVDVPLVASNRAQIEGSLIASGISAVVDAVQGGGAGAVSGIAGVLGDMVTSQFHSTRNGSYSSVLGWAETRKCFVVFIVPNAQYPRSYGHDIGYPCNLTYSLSQLSGFTKTVENVDISGISCTEEEAEEIRRLLAEGVYL